MRSFVHLLFLWCALLGAESVQANVALRHDAEGNLTNDGRWSYWWDAENRLIRVESTTNIASIARQRIEFLYDALGRRVQKRLATNNAGTWIFQYTNRYIHDGDLIVAEVDHLNRPQQSYVWGPGDEIHGPALAMVIDHTAGNAGHFAVTDASGHVTDLIAAGSGAPSARYEYAPFGEMIRASGAFAALNPIRFASQFTDDETGQTAFRYRVFSPSSGRWLSRDPLGEIDGPNLYAYVGNDPINDADPLGLVSSLNFAPAQLAWMGLDAGLGAGASVLEQKAAHPCDWDLNWWKVGAAGVVSVIEGRIFQRGFAGLERFLKAHWAVKLGRRLEQAAELRAKGHYGELAAMLAKHGDGFRDAFIAFRGANEARGVVSGVRASSVASASSDVSATLAAERGALRFTQTTASPMFSAEGSFAGRSISQVADALRSGTMRAAEVPVEFIVRDGNRLIVNTRSSLALRQAGIPEAQWNLINRTGVAEVEANITQRLLRNGLGNQGTDVLRITGSGSGASTYRWP